MKGVILAGGRGSRLFPMTLAVNKHLLPVFDKPMIYYPLTTMISASINEICIVCNRDDVIDYRKLLGNGSKFGARLTFKYQDEPRGVVDGILCALDFIEGDSVAVILGDNIFIDNGDLRRAVSDFAAGAHIFGLNVEHPDQYGVVELDGECRPTALIEKPARSNSRTAVTGFYLLDDQCSLLARRVNKSSRGEYEIIDLLNMYLNLESLSVTLLSRGTGWIDAGSPETYGIVSRYVESMQQMHGVIIGSPHEAALIRGYISASELLAFALDRQPSSYTEYLKDLAERTL